MADPLASRRRERERLLDLARAYAEGLRARLDLVGVVVVGSVARGDFNVWSDVDVVVVAETLPARAPERSALLILDAPAGVQPIGFTTEEFDAAWKGGNPLAREATEAGVILTEESFFGRYEPRPSHSSPPS